MALALLYQRNMIAHHDRVLRFIEGYASAYQTMTDESAARPLTDFRSLETKYVDLLKNRTGPIAGRLALVAVRQHTDVAQGG